MKENKLMQVVGIRLTEEQVMQLRQQVEAKHITLSTLGRVLFDKFLKGEMSI